MKLNHLNLTVTDVLATHSFLQTYFGLRPLGEADKNMGFLTDDNGMVLSMFRGKEVRYPNMFHIGFIQPNRESVNAINQRLAADGFDVPAPSQQHGSWTFYFQAPGGFTVGSTLLKGRWAGLPEEVGSSRLKLPRTITFLED